MSAIPKITLVALKETTLFAPLVALGFYVREQDLLAPIVSRVQFDKSTHTAHPVAALVDLWVSMLAGCCSVSHINTKIRPDDLLARAWGRQRFAEQSTVARVLDACHAEHVAQLRAGVDVIYRWMGQAPHHPWADDPLLIDIDLTGLPAGRHADGSTKGYFSAEKGGAGGSYAGSVRPPMMRVSHRSCIPGTR